MQQLNEFLKTANYQPVFAVGIAAVGVAICVVALVSLMHTLHVMGQKTPLYRNAQPVMGWSKRFYPASGVLIIFLLMLMWLLNVWSHSARSG